jgi:hypothetical protein
MTACDTSPTLSHHRSGVTTISDGNGGTIPAGQCVYNYMTATFVRSMCNGGAGTGFDSTWATYSDSACLNQVGTTNVNSLSDAQFCTSSTDAAFPHKDMKLGAYTSGSCSGAAPVKYYVSQQYRYGGG